MSLASLTQENKIQLIEMSLRHVRGHSPDSQVIGKDDWVQLTTPSAKSWFLNVIKHVELADSAVDGAITQAVEHYKKAGVPFSWQVGPSTRPENLGEALISKGFSVRDTTIGMIIESQRCASMTHNPVMTYRFLADDCFDDFLFTQKDAWDVPDRGIAWMRSHKVEILSGESENIRTVIGYFDGKPAVASAYMVYENKVLHLIGGAVVKDFRKQGIYKDMVRHRLALASELGINYVTVHCLENTSAPICTKIGFESVCKIVTYSSPKLSS